MIEKILDNYYCKKFNILVNRVVFCTDVNAKTLKKKDRLIVMIKHEKYKDDEYQVIFNIDIKNVFLYLCQYDITEKMLRRKIDNYLEDDVE